MARSTTKLIDIKKLADQGEVSGVALRLMNVVQDCSLADHSLKMWKQEEGKYSYRKAGARQYFLRLMLSHVFEAFEIIREIEQFQELKQAVEACSDRTQRSYQQLIEFKKSDDFRILVRVRNNIGFHYGGKWVVRSLRRIAKRQSTEYGKLTLGDNSLDWYFSLNELIENDIVLHEIAEIRQDEDPAMIDERINDVLMRLHEIAHVLADFAGYFTWECANRK